MGLFMITQGLSHSFFSTGKCLEDKSVAVSTVISDISLFLITSKSIKSGIVVRLLSQYVGLPGEIM